MQARVHRRCASASALTTELKPIQYTAPKQVTDTSAEFFRTCYLCLGTDGISPFIIEDCGHLFAAVLAFIYAFSRSTGVHPVVWKDGILVPTHKGGDTCLASNY